MSHELTPGREVFTTTRKILTAEEAAAVRSKLTPDTTVVVAGGGFDVFHSGHISFLEGSRQLGDVLFVLVSSDEILRVKGEDRPVHPQNSRMRIIAALECVDYVVPETGVESIGLLNPTIYARGIDYRWETMDPNFREYLARSGTPLAYVGSMGEAKTSAIIHKIRSGAK